MVRRQAPLLLLAILLLAAFGAALSQPTVVANTKDWQSLYLSLIYSQVEQARFLHLEDLADAQIKTKTISADSHIIILESSKPVVKNYGNYLRSNGFTDYETTNFEGFEELQQAMLSSLDYSGIVVLDPEFGVEALTIVPLIVEKKYLPIFLTPSVKSTVFSKAFTGKEILIVGHFPVRLIKDLPADMEYIKMQQENIEQLMPEIYKLKTENWGTILRADRVDLQGVIPHRPIYVYYGDMGSFANLLSNSPATNFEVIASDTADIAMEAERQAGRDFHFILKYARTFTNVPTYQGKLWDLDTVPFPYPNPLLSFEKVTYLPKMGVFALTVKNIGNMDILFSSNIEFNGVSLADDGPHELRPKQGVTIPYAISELTGDFNPESIINTRYGPKVPFARALLDESGSPILFANVESLDHFEQPEIILGKIVYNDMDGFFSMVLENPTSFPIKAFAEIPLSESSLVSSDTTTLPAKGKATVKVPTPYLLLSDILRDAYDINLYFGHLDTFTKKSFSVEDIEIIKPSPGRVLIGKIVAIGSKGIIIPMMILIALILFVLIRRRRNR